MTRYGTNSGHGHVWERPDGMKARCGGPMMCAECAKDYAEFERLTKLTTEGAAIRKDAERLPSPAVVSKPSSDGEFLRDVVATCQAAEAEVVRLRDEVERLTKERSVYCDKWHKELALGDRQAADLARVTESCKHWQRLYENARVDLSSAVSHGADLMRASESQAAELSTAVFHGGILLRANQALEAEAERLRQVCRNVYEVWAGSEGLPMPETAPEAYLRQLVIQMKDEAKEGLK